MGLTENTNVLLSPGSSDTFLMDNYQRYLDSGELSPDPFQWQAMEALQVVYNDLLKPHPHHTNKKRFSNFFSIVGKKTEKHPLRKGLYLWGGVGRGKTHLVDYFFRLIPGNKKLRLHFHRFMQIVHEELKQHKHIEDPLKQVAQHLASQTEIICLDEMHVNDITDAMLLGKLFEYLFEQGIILVTTSNRPPHDLYKNGLQRERFIPAIKLLEENTRVMQMGGDEDYRLRTLEHSGTYHIATGKLSEQRLETYFHKLSGIELHQGRHDIIIKKRSIPVKMWADGVVWFDFDVLCNSARSVDDYIKIANYFHTVLISNIPIMDKNRDDAARRFVNMIDEFYDLHVNIVVTAEAEPEKIYTGERLAFEFDRTASRLREMQSKEYMHIKHLS